VKTRKTAADIFPIAEKIASSLGEGWHVEPRVGPAVSLVGTNARELSLSFDWENQNLLKIAGWIPQDMVDHYPNRHGGVVVQIGVTASRGIDAIVTEINRRLLPKYDKILGQIAARAEVLRIEQEITERVIEGLHAAAPRVRRSGNELHLDFVRGRASVKNIRSDGVDLVLHGVAPEVAEAVLQLIAGNDDGTLELP
jgi:hypothetical protein